MYQKTSKRRWTSIILTGTKLNLWLGLPRKLWSALAALCFSPSPFLSHICLQFLKATFILWNIFSRFIKKNKTFLLGFLISPYKSPFYSFHDAYILLYISLSFLYSKSFNGLSHLIEQNTGLLPETVYIPDLYFSLLLVCGCPLLLKEETFFRF